MMLNARLRKIFSIFLLLIFIFLLLACAGAYWLYTYRLTAPLPTSEDWQYTIPTGTSLNTIAEDLNRQGQLDTLTAFAWVYLARLEKKAQQIKAGEYAIPAGTSPQGLLTIFTSGKTIQYSLTIPEGINFRELIIAVQAHPKIKHTLKNLDAASVMQAIGIKHEQYPEGLFYPDTYNFPANTTDVAFLQRAYQLMATELETAWQQRVDNLPLKTPYEALTLASIVEKETGVASERAQIAGVFIRRLQKGMRLQTDPTVIYALGEAYDGNIRSKDLEVDSPYNTYRYTGLPPTPIALPSKAALQAAVNPDKGDSLYFVAKGDGSHYFSATQTEHSCAVIQYQLKDKAPAKYRQWCGQYPSCSACRAN
ncbi:hypothetical protein BegalDRAFT_2006 [Beggiatoa alba B18LD]|uniref:Endolytic murein transglycosylase n=1 Tax=Beggiatoa alba B18LD TaxID=395493 RepID=I3CGX9_9GAMM|nr:endolytic transglycosylase MltG [Beggiatoa alba]EIJ42872.1 hypothetical protein BegalDRAFT_2006 [Beggiatoa alba B18LD]